ncbi:Transmembrane 9 superfamily member 2 [Hondaea fermentalgiana]|uniref:Transmembrane 9 superfamily member n=1 Tax=Hondaea fermentalgiana TaxID=2315210 RepID=A0A2R5GNT8_9STRA|nr:Transmembrane 9 superfamily member 2 [Hondaea fermentalgiana]|eukprot:GBG32557.1 Transmembrane 9 superfamily member 2 [Hondaea fermentalgiana]
MEMSRGVMTRWAAVALVLLAACLAPVLGGGETYKDGDPVRVVANKIGPYFNPTETYEYYSLPFCAPDKMEKESHNLGEILAGDRKVLTHYDIKFKVPNHGMRLCTKTLSLADLQKFQRAVDEDYYFEMLVDNLPVWAYVGLIHTPSLLSSPPSFPILGDFDEKSLENISAKRFLYTHLIFNIDYNGDRIVSAQVATSPSSRLDITDVDSEITVDFTYAVIWKESSVRYEDRVERYQKADFLPATVEIHWLSIINSFVLVILLTAFLAMIMVRVLHNDMRYLIADEEEEFGSEDESGWKLLHADVFRFPVNKTLFAAVLGAGTHLLCATVLLLLLALFAFSPGKKGSLPKVIAILYPLTAGTSGYVSASVYKQMGGFNWVWNTILTSVLFPGPLFIMFCICNSVAISYESTAALPFWTIVSVFATHLLMTFPLTVLGAIIGKRNAKPFEAPCRTSKVPRQTPHVPWHKSLAQVLVAGFLPFSAIYIEVHYIFTSIWGHKVYSLYGILFLAFVLLLTVTAAITVTLVYFQLAAEDHRWWWRSMLYGGSTGFFIYLYSFYYYSARSRMNGTLQTTFFFGYMLILSYGVTLMLGTVGFFSSLSFTKYIYKQLKLD